MFNMRCSDILMTAKTANGSPATYRRDRARINGEFFALDNTCTHDAGSLAEGEIGGHEVICPLHGAKFDIRTGEVLGPPAYENVARYSVRVTGTDIEVEV